MLAPLEGCCYSLDITIIFFFWVVHELRFFVCLSRSPARWTDVLYFTTLASLSLSFCPSHPIGLGSSSTSATEVTRYRPCLYVCNENIQTCEYVQVRTEAAVVGQSRCHGMDPKPFFDRGGTVILLVAPLLCSTFEKTFPKSFPASTELAAAHPIHSLVSFIYRSLLLCFSLLFGAPVVSPCSPFESGQKTQTQWLRR